jgi:DNA polymerase
MGIDVWQLRDATEALESPAIAETAVDNQAVAPAALKPQPAPQLAPQPAIDQADWEKLNHAIRGCAACELHNSRQNAVCGVGDHQADWLIIGEAPGADEDKQGEPFVGRAGQLLNEMLRAIGLRREQVFIANVLKCRPPDNRDPHPAEIEQCLPYLHRQIELLQPKIILVVGRIAAQTLLNVETPVGKLRGTVHEFAGVPLVVTYHPAYLLRRASEKGKSWADLLLAMDAAGQT